jgi:signal recognition particle GTPase
MIIAYCKYHYSFKYSFLVMMEALFFTNLKTAVAGLGANKMAELKQIQEAMEVAQRELLAFDNNKELVKTLYKKINSDKIELAPEDIARKIKEGKPPIDEED